jgi:hypothetical protein
MNLFTTVFNLANFTYEEPLKKSIRKPMSNPIGRRSGARSDGDAQQIQLAMPRSREPMLIEGR